MLEWFFGENREGNERKQDFNGHVERDTVTMESVSGSSEAAEEDLDSFLFGESDTSGEEDGDKFSIESPDTPEKQAQLSLLQKVRKDVEDFDYHITQNEIHLKHSREQLIGFRAFVQKTDVEMAQIHRLHQQNAELEHKIGNLDKRGDELRNLLDQEKALHSATKNRNSDFKNVLGAARSEIVTLSERDAKLREQLEQYSISSSKREVVLLEASRQAEQLLAENKVLEENYQRANFDMNKYYTEATVLQKTLDEIKENGRQGTAEIDRLSADVASTTETLDRKQAENIELRSRLDNMVAENSANDKRNSSNIRIRDEELFSLRSQAEGLQSELRVRNQMLTQANEENKNSIEEIKVSSAVTQSMSEKLAHEVSQNEEQRKHLTEANEKIAEINERYKERLGELEFTRQENLRLKRLLKAELQMFEQSINRMPVAKNGSKKSQPQAAAPEPDNQKLN